MAYEIGKIGLSDPEIEEETQSTRQAVIARSGEEWDYFYLKTPQEIHRSAVLAAMRMANSCIIYNNFGGWEHQKSKFTEPWDTRGAREPKYEGTEEQRKAYALTYAELSSIWSAQCARIAKARIYRNVIPDTEEGGPYHGVRW